MDDLSNASKFFLIFAGAVVLYGAILATTGDESMLPYRARISVPNRAYVQYLGRIVVMVGLVIGALSLLLLVFAGLR